MKRTADDRRWSRAIRERDGFRCQLCGAVHSESSTGLHAAHIFSRGIKRTRLDLENGIALCYACHVRADGNPALKEELARKLLGDERYDALRLRAHTPIKKVQFRTFPNACRKVTRKGCGEVGGGAGHPRRSASPLPTRVGDLSVLLSRDCIVCGRRLGEHSRKEADECLKLILPAVESQGSEHAESTLTRENGE